MNTTVTIHDTIERVPPADFVPSRWQRRAPFDPKTRPADAELLSSVKTAGVLEPVIYWLNEEGQRELLTGHRRVSAALLAGNGNGRNATVPALRAEGDPQALHVLLITDNLQRDDLTPLEEAEHYRDLIEQYDLSQREVARLVGKSQGHISQVLSLLGAGNAIREALTTEEIRFSDARALVTVPEEVQPAVVEKARQMIAGEGRTAATKQKITAFARQVRTFLEPDRFTVPDGEVVRPELRNGLALISYLIEKARAEGRLGEVIVALYERKYETQQYVGRNLLTANPLDFGPSEFQALAWTLTDGNEVAWSDFAKTFGRTCETCVLGNVRLEAAWPSLRAYCRHVAGDERVTTCMKHIGPSDPVVLPLENFYLERAATALGLETRHTMREQLYLDSVEAYAQVYQAALEMLRQEKAERERESMRKHLQPLRTFWRLQEEGRLATDHPQAHACRQCAHFVPDGGNPPCQYATKPLISNWGWTRPPQFGVLVSEDRRLLLPRCEMFRYAVMPDVWELPGWQFGDRRMVLAWLRRLAAVGSGNDHYGTIYGVLSWLPYKRPFDKAHLLDGLIRWIKHNWDELGDGRVAMLITVGVYEAKALSSYSGWGRIDTIALVNPLTGEEEIWYALGWEAFLEKRKPYGWEGPAPWVEEEEEKADG